MTPDQVNSDGVGRERLGGACKMLIELGTV